MSARILVVEDEPSIADSVAYALRGDGFEIETVALGEAALEAVAERTFDLMILDIMLPGISGIEVCRRIRADSTLPILMLTARTAEVDTVVGLDAGADDYVQKPFSIPELLSRVRAILRRSELDAGDGRRSALRIGGLELDFWRHTVTVDGRPVELTHSEFRLLALLADRPGRAYSRRELMEHLWESAFVGDERACDMHVSNLRRKIEREPARPERLLTVRGLGYKLAAA